MKDFVMPSLGADMEEATVVKWLVSPGDEVERGQIVVVVETVKGAVDVEVFESGVVEAILVEEGVKAPVGAPLAKIGPGVRAPASMRIDGDGSGGAETASRPAPSRAEPASPTGEDEGAVGATTGGTAPARTRPAPPGPGGRRTRVSDERRRRMSPAARRRAREAGLDPSEVAPERAGRPIVISDVERAVASARGEEASATPAEPPSERPAEPPAKPPAEPPAKPPAKPPAEPRSEEPRARGQVVFDRAEMRRAIAAAMARSKREIPHFYLGHTVDLADAERFREEYNRQRDPSDRILMVALFAKATALALERVSDLNGHYGELGFEPASEVNLGVAIHLRGGGLVAPALLDASTRPLPELMAALTDLVARARGGGLRASEMSRATATLTSLGDRGVDSVIGVIHPPQVAMIGFGRVARRVVAREDAIAIHPVVDLSLAADHRVCAGHLGARFLRTIDELLQTPEEL